MILSRLGKEVELISKVGNDEAGTRVLGYIHDDGSLRRHTEEEIFLLTGEKNPIANAELLVQAGVSSGEACGVASCAVERLGRRME